MMDDNDRSQWIDNDEGLYNWWRGSRQSKRTFIRENRAEIDVCIHRVLDAPPAPSPSLAGVIDDFLGDLVERKQHTIW